MMDWSQQIGCSKLVLALFLALGCRGRIVESSPFCTDGTATPPVSISDVIKQSFTADIYSVVLDTRSTFRVREHYSDETQKSAVVYSAAEEMTDTKFHIYNRKTKRGFSNLAGPPCAANDNPPDFGLMSLKLKNRRAATYVGRETVNEEPLHLWRACSETAGSEVNEELYTTDASADWDFALDGDYIPVKMVVKTRDKATGTVSQVDHYILRYETRDDAEPGFQSDLEPPVGVACEAAPDVSIPQLPKNFIYSTESIVQAGTTATVIVDDDHKVIISDTLASADERLPYYIDSYDTGVFFTMTNNRYDTCFPKPYSILKDGENRGQYLSYTDSDNRRFFENLKYFIDNLKGFTYNGKYIDRGIPCDVYTKTYDDFRGNGKTTVVFYFSSDDAVHTRDSRQLPLRKDVWNKGFQRFTDNIYDSGVLDYSHLEFDPLDISHCRAKLGAIDFGLLFESKAEGSKLTNVEDSVRRALATAAGVSELRVHITDVSLQHSKIIVRGTLIGRAAYNTTVVDFSPAAIGYPANVSDDIESHTYRDYTSYEECKSKFGGDDDVEAVSYCPYSSTCTTFSRLPDTPHYDPRCDGFINRNNKISLDIHEAWNNLIEAVDSGKVQVQDFTASQIAQVTGVADENITLPSLQKYKKIPGARIHEVTSTRSDMELRKCAEDCTNSIGGECETFTYCESSRYCYTHPNPERNSDVKIDQEAHCDLYIRKYVTEFQAIQATSAVVDTEQIFEILESPDECARLCVTNTNFRCESFDFCTLEGGAGSATCFLGKRHYFELADAGKKANLSETACTHYARDYHGDYERKNGMTTLTVRATMKESTPESCAHSCSKESASGEAACTMFHFCALGGRCELIEESAITSDAVRRNPELTDAIGCSTYSLREKLAKAQKRAAVSRQKAQKAMVEFLTKANASDGSGYGPGAMAGVAFAMLCLGVGILLLGLFMWSRFQRTGGVNLPWRSHDNVDLSMKFSKSQVCD